MLRYSIAGLCLLIAVLFMPSWKGGRQAYQSGWGSTIAFAFLGVALVVLLGWR